MSLGQSHWLWRVFGLVLLTAVATILRLDGNEFRAVAGDEAFSWRITQFSVPELIQRAKLDVHPPFYYLLLKSWEMLLGDSPRALRSFSAICGLLCIPLVYLNVTEALCWPGRLAPTATRPNACVGAGSHGGGWIAACLVALHLSQIHLAQTARMYALGALLAALSSWLLLRALRSQQRPLLWWSGYGLSVAAFCYTHYYAFFAVAAQVVFVAFEVVSVWRSKSVRQAVRTFTGFAFAAALAVIWYSPWIPVLLNQTQEVRENYWIPPLTVPEAEAAVFRWSAGVEYPGSLEGRAWFLLFGSMIAWSFLSAPRSSLLFFLLAGVPWLLSIGLSLLSGRWIFYERYLMFSQLALLCFWGIAWEHLCGGVVARVLFAALLFGPMLFELAVSIPDAPTRPPAIAEAITYIGEQYQPGDLVLAETAATVHRLRYYAAQGGIAPIEVRCDVSAFPAQGHVAHVAALSPEDLLPLEWIRHQLRWRRVWCVSDSISSPPAVPSEWVLCGQRAFEGGGKTRCSVVLYAPPVVVFPPRNGRQHASAE